MFPYKNNEDLYIRTDGEEEAISNLEMLDRLSLDVFRNVYYWKWIVIVLHSCVQAFMVITLRQTDGSGIHRENEEARVRQSGEALVEANLASFEELYRRIESKKYPPYSGLPEIALEPDLKAKIEKLNSLRNDFIHFKPMHWAIGVHQSPNFVLVFLEFIWKMGKRHMFYKTHNADRFSAHLQSCIQHFQSLEAIHSAIQEAEKK